MLVLGIEVADKRTDQWRRWLMPSVQPVVLPNAEAQHLGLQSERARLSFELVDTFELYGLTDDDAVVWLTRGQFAAMPQAVRRAQPAPHRWPRVTEKAEVEQAIRYVEFGRRASRHREVSEQQWSSISTVLPGAREIAGTFPDRSGPNCFAAVMAAAGVSDAAEQWMQLQPFEEWLAAETAPGGADDEIGTVLVWRTSSGEAAHAAMTIGDGRLLHEPSQGWMSPTKVLNVDEGKLSARMPGQFLHRYRLV